MTLREIRLMKGMMREVERWKSRTLRRAVGRPLAILNSESVYRLQPLSCVVKNERPVQSDYV